MRKLIVFALVGFVAQLVDGALGMAYGATSTTLLLAAGFAPALASASVHLAEVGTTLVSGLAHWRFGNVDWGVVRPLALPGALGALVGALLLSHFSTEAAAPWMAAVLLTLGIIVLARFSRGVKPVDGRQPVPRRFLRGLGLVAGFVDATGGGGWGPIASPALLAGGRLQPRAVVGSVDTSEFLVSAAASVGFLIGLGTGSLDFALVGTLLGAGVAAAPLAAWLVRILPARYLGVSVGGLIVLTNLRTLLAVFEVAGASRIPFYLGAVAVWVGCLVAAGRAGRRAVAGTI